MKNILLDLGGVLYAIDSLRFHQEISTLAENSGKPLEEKSLQYFLTFCHKFECGLMNPSDFRHKARQQFFPGATDEQIDAAWNSILIGLMEGRTELVRELAKRHRVFLLSNTNAIHFQALYAESDEMFDHMERLFLSFEMGVRKPDATIYKQVLEIVGLKPSETLFVDDSLDNVRAAQRLGIKTHHLVNPEELPAVLMA